MLIFIYVIFAIQVNADHGQWDCQSNEIFIECGSCEASCKMPLIKNCSKECRPPRCECQSINGFVRAHDGACIHVSECQTYTLMSQLYPGHHIPSFDQHNFLKKPSSAALERKKHRKTSKSQTAHYDPPPTESPPLNTDYTEEVEVTDQPLETTTTLAQHFHQNSKSASDEEENEDTNNLPPAIAPFDYGGAKKLTNQAKPAPPYKPNNQHHVLDRDSALVGTKHHSSSLITDSSPGQITPTRSHPFGFPEETEDELGREGGYSLQAPTQNNQQQIYGARPVLRGEVSDKYVPKMPSSIGAPSSNPTPPGTSGSPPYQYAYAPSSHALQQDDSAYALYPPQKYRIYRRKREMPIGPPIY